MSKLKKIRVKDEKKSRYNFIEDVFSDGQHCSVEVFLNVITQFIADIEPSDDAKIICRYDGYEEYSYKLDLISYRDETDEELNIRKVLKEALEAREKQMTLSKEMAERTMLKELKAKYENL